MDFLLDIASFAIKAALIVAAIGFVIALIVRRAKGGKDVDDLQITCLNDRYDDREAELNGEILPAKAAKALAKTRRKAAKQTPPQDERKRIYVVDFDGDTAAATVKQLADQVDALLMVARPGTDEIVVRVESPGGTITGYGLAAAQLLRLRAAKLALTVCVDQVAASGGYMMACTAEKIVAAPFAVVGSIGVLAQVPNLNKLLRKNDIDYEEFTAGEFKRSVSLLGEITPAGRAHFRQKLDAAHVAFSAFVARNRPQLDIAKVANGDFWHGEEALGLGLVDELMASDDYLFRARSEARIFKVALEQKKTLVQQVIDGLGLAFEAALARLLSRAGPGDFSI